MTNQTTEDLQKNRDELRAEIREARGTLKDLRYEIKTARNLAETTRQLAAELAQTQVRDLLEAEVTRQVTALGEQTQQQMSKSTAKVIAEFDKLHDLLLGHDPTVLARARRAASRNATEADRE